MWWLVAMSPPLETKPPEPPLLKRTDASRARSSQASVSSKPYLSRSSLRGGSLSSHMPSSAYTVVTWVSKKRMVAKDAEDNVRFTAGPSLGVQELFEDYHRNS